MKHFLITNREILTDKNGNEHIRPDGKEYAGDNLRFGTYDLDKKEFELFPEPKSEADLLYSSIKANTKPEKLYGSSRLFKEMYDEMCKDERVKGDTLVFIHGFNTNLKSVEEAFANLHKNYVEPKDNPIKHIIILTWPGQKRNVPLHYYNDAKDAKRSGEAFARSVDKLIEFFAKFLGPSDGGNEACGKNLHLMVHSMGNQVLEHMILTLLKTQNNLPELFKSISLVAADVEYNIFENHKAFYKLIDFGDKVHIYYHVNDKILDISNYTKNLNNRLGRFGRKNIDAGLLDVFDVDCSSLSQDQGNLLSKKANHWYYYTSSYAVAEIKKGFK